MQVNVDADKPSALRTMLGALGSLGGAVAGTFALPGAGTFAGASLGAAAGGGVGNLTGGVADSAINSGKDLQGGGVKMGGPIQRRVDQAGEDPFQHLTDALNVLHTLPEAMQDQVKEPLQQAYLKAAPTQARFKNVGSGGFQTDKNYSGGGSFA